MIHIRFHTLTSDETRDDVLYREIYTCSATSILQLLTVCFDKRAASVEFQLKIEDQGCAEHGAHWRA